MTESGERRALIVAPGRGSYGATELGWLARIERGGEREREVVGGVVTAVDRARARRGLGSIRELDAARSYSKEMHGDAENASALIFACSLVDARLVQERLAVAGVLGNSLGFYSALAISGALSLEDAATLVVEMAALQAKLARGRQALYPTVGDDWRPSHEREAAVSAALRALEDRAFPSIHAGGLEVLAVADEAAGEVEKLLPRVKLSGRDFPVFLDGHKGYHSPLAADVARAARDSSELAALRFLAPRAHLVDGRGAIFSPWSTDPGELAAYTLDFQLREAFDLHASLRTALRELAPACLVVLGPGESGGMIAQSLVRERFFGLGDKEAFQARQARDPVVFSLGRSDQRAALFSG